MAKLNMDGPYDFISESIDKSVTESKPGNYALGYINDSKQFVVKYVGRSDSNVNGRLKQQLGKAKSNYKNFKFSYATSPKAAFEKECINFHDFGGTTKLDNSIHPDRPENTSWKCPKCNIFN